MINGRKRPFFLYWKNVISDIYNNNGGNVTVNADNSDGAYKMAIGKNASSVEKVLALAHSIRLICDNRVADAKFSIIADSSKSNYGNANNGIKSIFIGEYIPPAKQDGTPSQKLISFAFKQGANKPIGCTYTISEGYAISDILVHLCKKCMDLEIEAKGLNVGAPIVRNNQPKTIPNGNVNQSGYNPAPQSNPGQVEQNFQNAFQSFEGNQSSEDFNPFG